MKNLKVIFLNGPPLSGKDTSGELIWQMREGVDIFKMSQPIKTALLSFLNLNDDTSYNLLESMKETPSDMLFGKSWRELQISLAEDWAKKHLSHEVFGELLKRRIHQASKNDRSLEYIVVTDSGFSEEATPIVEMVGPSNCFLIRLHRKGCDFTKDSRGYIDLSDSKVDSLDVINNGSLRELKMELLLALNNRWNFI